ncbi:HipA domain-containing protein [Cyanobium sp. Cruz-8H5]|uniref:HipA domain-containing protein n=1 Tax=Cyanobium sp. Cruz-8H5 TaxID=2823712 RepID=UPI0020CC7914|nr:HipA domain-containing protein [Cyanobium sp. Cruz-8H5]MCP9861400.1 HipA domain-containing protein [Cyanobium sp. Cruz-8H5]
MPFAVRNVSDWSAYQDEQMGSKTKLWVLDHAGQRWLFKERRHDHGEDWAEKLVAEVAELLGIHHAVVELTQRNGIAGVISRDFLDPGREFRQLMHGNELLVQRFDSYQPHGPNFTTNQHTVSRALSVLQQDFIVLGVNPRRPPGISSAVAEFVGYLMLDALVGNTDRHHENWAIVVLPDGTAELAPSFDHASSLGRELPDPERIRRMSGAPSAPTFEKYWRKMPSRWYRDPDDKRCLHPLDAFRMAAERFPDAAAVWIRQLDRLTDAEISRLTDSVPSEVASGPARQFAALMLRFGRDQLLRLGNVP